jgi:tetrahydromethanopterin S-methyltransferase subunit G
MKMYKLLVIILFSLFLLPGVVPAKENRSTFERETTEKLIRIETKVDEGQKAINQRIDDMGKRVDDMRGLLYVVLGGMIALVGFVIWDRRTALAPAIKRTKDLEERGEKIEMALREYAKKDPTLMEILKELKLL